MWDPVLQLWVPRQYISDRPAKRAKREPEPSPEPAPARHVAGTISSRSWHLAEQLHESLVNDRAVPPIGYDHEVDLGLHGDSIKVVVIDPKVRVHSRKRLFRSENDFCQPEPNAAQVMDDPLGDLLGGVGMSFATFGLASTSSSSGGPAPASPVPAALPASPIEEATPECIRRMDLSPESKALAKMIT